MQNIYNSEDVENPEEQFEPKISNEDFPHIKKSMSKKFNAKF